MSKKKFQVVVVGSCMIDFTSYCPRLPKEGETIHGSKFTTTTGGKGANQCVAAAKLGATIALVARVGDDVWGKHYIDNLHKVNVNTKYVEITPGFSSGIAQINVAESGANQIVIIAGSNDKLSPEDVERAEDIISEADVVISQLETPPEVAIKAMKLCKGISILNGAPALAKYDAELLTLPSIFCVNESEAEVFAGVPVNSIDDAKKAINVLREQKGCQTVVLTMGSQGTVYSSKDTSTLIHVSSTPVKSVDSTGAGDAFIGALAYLLATKKEKLTFHECVEAANYIAADTVTRPGTQSSFSGPEILEEYYKTKEFE
ncbi:hypothetical protein ILUMI_23460 [Ignelater luminosus]|uniref:Ribokinase n=1 Tax=Ignelater luminosus TaxID=2038154 RepID=A0A8K0CEL2_IGNLU|nr:hypothetical protein ILUMI_23460 [Ignelater luminosus]